MFFLLVNLNGTLAKQMEVATNIWIAGMMKVTNLEWLATVGAQMLISCGNSSAVYTTRFKWMSAGTSCSDSTCQLIKNNLIKAKATNSTIVFYGDLSSCATVFLEYQLIVERVPLKTSLEQLLSMNTKYGAELLPSKKQLFDLGIRELDTLNEISIDGDFNFQNVEIANSKTSDEEITLRNERASCYRQGESILYTTTTLDSNLKKLRILLESYCGDDHCKTRALYLGLSESKFISDVVIDIAVVVCDPQSLEKLQNDEKVILFTLLDFLSGENRFIFQNKIRSIVGQQLLSSIQPCHEVHSSEELLSIVSLLRNRTGTFNAFISSLTDFVSPFIDQNSVFPIVLSPSWEPVIDQQVSRKLESENKKILSWKSSALDLPPPLSEIGSKMCFKFKSVHSGKSISGFTFLGDVVVLYYFKRLKQEVESNAVSELKLSVMSAVVLLLFNSVDSLNIKTISSSLPSMTKSDITNALRPLTSSKHRILTREGDRFQLNSYPRLSRKVNLFHNAD